jgi:DNA end-binding protein Ku
MATRPTWQGHLRLSLVTCPVALYTGVSATGEVHFNLLHKDTLNRIRMIPTDPETGPVERADLVKGYEVDKGRFVVITDDEIKAVRLESTRTLDIERFVDAGEIDRLYWNDPYYLTPDGKMATEAFGVIREAMAQSGKLALGRVVLHQRERLMALEPRDQGIVAYSLRPYDEVRNPAEYFDAIAASKPDPKMIDIAGKIIEQLEGPFDPTQFDDRYETALKALIAEKQKGHKIEAVQEPDTAEPGDLMEALRRSLGQTSEPRTRKTAAKPPWPPRRRAQEKARLIISAGRRLRSTIAPIRNSRARPSFRRSSQARFAR